MKSRRVPFVLLNVFPDGETRLHTAPWDEDMLEAAGVADVRVEVAPGYWTPRRVGVLRDRLTDDLWLSGWSCFMPLDVDLALGMEALNEPAVEAKPTPPQPPVRKPAVHKPSPSFLARFGR